MNQQAMEDRVNELQPLIMAASKNLDSELEKHQNKMTTKAQGFSDEIDKLCDESYKLKRRLGLRR